MNVTVHALDFTVKTAQHVSENYFCRLNKLPVLNQYQTNFFFFYFGFVFTAEFLTWVKVNLKPSPNTVHYILTHFKSLWNIVNKVSFLRNGIMRYVLTCKLKLFMP